jgi:hypothetical protein
MPFNSCPRHQLALFLVFAWDFLTEKIELLQWRGNFPSRAASFVGEYFVLEKGVFFSGAGDVWMGCFPWGFLAEKTKFPFVWTFSFFGPAPR